MMRGKSALLCGSIVLAAIATPAIARADDPPPLPPPTQQTTTTATGTVDTVHLRNGGMFRGHVTEIMPGSHVTIIVEGKAESQRIPWPEVDRVIVSSTAVPPPPGARTPAAPTPPTPAPMVGPRAHVRINSPKQVFLYRRPAGSTSFVQQCVSPCDQELPIGDTYRVTGNGVAQSKEFHLGAAPGGSVEINVEPPSTGGMILGGFMAGGGASAAYVGLILTLAGFAAGAQDCSDPYIPQNSTRPPQYYRDECHDNKETGEVVRNVGLVTMGVGAVLTVVGIIVFLNNASTEVTMKGGARAEGKTDVPRPLDAFLRAPVYRGAASSAEMSASAPPASFPVLFTGRF